MNKKAFGLIELTLALAIAAIVGFIIIRAYSEAQEAKTAESIAKEIGIVNGTICKRKAPETGLFFVKEESSNPKKQGKKMFNITVVNKKSGATGFYIGRPSALGNPYTSKSYGQGIKVETLQQSIDEFEGWLKRKIEVKDQAVIKEINKIYEAAKAGPINIVCWCAPGPCHGDIVKKFVSGMTMRCT